MSAIITTATVVFTMGAVIIAGGYAPTTGAIQDLLMLTMVGAAFVTVVGMESST